MSDVTDHICTVRDETGNWSVLLIESSFWLNVWQTLWRDLCVMTICGNIMLIIFLVQLLHCFKVLQFPSLGSMWIGTWRRASWDGMIQILWSLFLRWNNPKWVIFLSRWNYPTGAIFVSRGNYSIPDVLRWKMAMVWGARAPKYRVVATSSSLMERTLVKMLHVLPGNRSVDLETWSLAFFHRRLIIYLLLISYVSLLIYLRYDVAVTHTHLCMENHFTTISKILLFSIWTLWILWILWFQLPDRDICTFFVSSLLLFHWDLVCCTSPEIFHSRFLFLFFLATDVFPVELVQFPRNKNTSSI